MSNHRPRPGFPLRGPAAARIAFRLAVLLSGITAPTAGLAAAQATSRQTVPVASLTAPRTPVLDGLDRFIDHLRAGRLEDAHAWLIRPAAGDDPKQQVQRELLELRRTAEQVRTGALRVIPIVELTDAAHGVAVVGVLIDDELRPDAAAILDGRRSVRPQLMIRDAGGDWRPAMTSPDQLGLDAERREALDGLLEALTASSDDFRTALLADARRTIADATARLAAAMPEIIAETLPPGWTVRPGLTIADLRRDERAAGPLAPAISDLNSRGLFGFAVATADPPDGGEPLVATVAVFASRDAFDERTARLEHDEDVTPRRPDLGDASDLRRFVAAGGRAFSTDAGRSHAGMLGTWVVEVADDAATPRAEAAAAVHDALVGRLPSMDAARDGLGDLEAGGYLGPLAALVPGWESWSPPEAGDSLDIELHGIGPCRAEVFGVAEFPEELYRMRLASRRAIAAVTIKITVDGDLEQNVHATIFRFESPEAALTYLQTSGANGRDRREGFTRADRADGATIWTGAAPGIPRTVYAVAGPHVVTVVGFVDEAVEAVTMLADEIVARMTPAWTLAFDEEGAGRP